MADLTEEEVQVQVDEALSLVCVDARIAWLVLKGLQESRLLGPWEQSGGAPDCWVRRTERRVVQAVVFWATTPDGERRAVGRLYYEPIDLIELTDGEWKVRGLPEAGAYGSDWEAADAAQAHFLGDHEFPVIALAVKWVDEKLRALGWELVPTLRLEKRTELEELFALLED